MSMFNSLRLPFYIPIAGLDYTKIRQSKALAQFYKNHPEIAKEVQSSQVPLLGYAIIGALMRLYGAYQWHQGVKNLPTSNIQVNTFNHQTGQRTSKIDPQLDILSKGAKKNPEGAFCYFLGGLIEYIGTFMRYRKENKVLHQMFLEPEITTEEVSAPNVV